MDWRTDRMNGHPGEQGEGDRCMRLWRPERRAQQTTLGFITRMPEPLAPFPAAAMVTGMTGQWLGTVAVSAEPSHTPPHVISGAALLALELSKEARGIRGLDVLRRSVDRAPPVSL